MAVATISLTLENDLLEKLDFFANNESLTRTDLINNSIRMYITKRQRLQELYKYGEQIASRGNFTEEDIMNEIRDYRNNK